MVGSAWVVFGAILDCHGHATQQDCINLQERGVVPWADGRSEGEGVAPWGVGREQWWRRVANEASVSDHQYFVEIAELGAERSKRVRP